MQLQKMQLAIGTIITAIVITLSLAQIDVFNGKADLTQGQIHLYHECYCRVSDDCIDWDDPETCEVFQEVEFNVGMYNTKETCQAGGRCLGDPDPVGVYCPNELIAIKPNGDPCCIDYPGNLNDAELITCPAGTCGDGTQDRGEQCDDGNTNNNDGCSSSCKEEICGDGVVQLNEECEGGFFEGACESCVCVGKFEADPDNNGSCRKKCTNGQYVNGVCTCNEGYDYDSEKAECVKIECGNGRVEEGESCDDGNQDDSDGCTSDCKRCSGLGEACSEIQCCPTLERTDNEGNICYSDSVMCNMDGNTPTCEISCAGLRDDCGYDIQCGGSTGGTGGTGSTGGSGGTGSTGGSGGTGDSGDTGGTSDGGNDGGDDGGDSGGSSAQSSGCNKVDPACAAACRASFDQCIYACEDSTGAQCGCSTANQNCHKGCPTTPAPCPSNSSTSNGDNGGTGGTGTNGGTGGGSNASTGSTGSTGNSSVASSGENSSIASGGNSSTVNSNGSNGGDSGDNGGTGGGGTYCCNEQLGFCDPFGSCDNPYQDLFSCQEECGNSSSSSSSEVSASSVSSSPNFSSASVSSVAITTYCCNEELGFCDPFGECNDPYISLGICQLECGVQSSSGDNSSSSLNTSSLIALNSSSSDNSSSSSEASSSVEDSSLSSRSSISSISSYQTSSSISYENTTRSSSSRSTIIAGQFSVASYSYGFTPTLEPTVTPVITYCGDNTLQQGEQCERGMNLCINGRTCSLNTCTCITDEEAAIEDDIRIIEEKETLVAAASICGNGVLEIKEECDDANRRNNDGCSESCLLEIGICGDGKVQTLLGEQCEQSRHDSSLPYTCVQCRFVFLLCGDGTVNPGEECDDGPLNSTKPDADCRPDCSLSRCGDAILDSAELCDDGNALNGDGCDRYCRTETEDSPTVIAYQSSSMSSQTQVLASFFDQSGNPQYQQFPQYPNFQGLPQNIQLAQLQPLIQNQAPIGDTGPAAVAVIGAGAAAGVGWMRRKRRP